MCDLINFCTFDTQRNAKESTELLIDRNKLCHKIIDCENSANALWATLKRFCNLWKLV